MPCRPVRLIVCAALWLAAVPASAQPDSGTVFFTVGALANIERTSQSSGFGENSDLDGTVPGGALGLGVYLTPSVSARVEWVMTGWLEYDTAGFIYPLAAAGTGVIASPLIVPRFEGERMSKAGFALLGYRLGPPRAAVELLGGIGWLAQSTRSSFDYGIPIPAGVTSGLSYPYGESRTTTYGAVGVAGFDATVALTDHAAVVPQFRTYVANGTLSLRPGLSFRWTF